jgi:hypothetical protein
MKDLTVEGYCVLTGQEFLISQFPKLQLPTKLGKLLWKVESRRTSSKE